MPAPEVLDVFYPIVPDAGWARRLVPLGIRTVQLRYKGTDADEIRREISECLELCIANDCQLIVNDHWQAAINVGADFVHLGQEDLAEADVSIIKAAGVRLGISTHDEAELEIALAAEPDYVALGPIWETKLKVMKWGPQGLDRVRAWKQRIGDLPLCAIGGITPERAPGVLDAGADTVAVITDFFTHADPESRVRQWLSWAEEVRS
jgi:thiamine-phosphate pyrophosphorylase